MIVVVFYVKVIDKNIGLVGVSNVQLFYFNAPQGHLLSNALKLRHKKYYLGKL